MADTTENLRVEPARTLDEIKAAATDDSGLLWCLLGVWDKVQPGPEATKSADRIDKAICAALDEAYAAGRGPVPAFRAILDAIDTQDAEIARLKAIVAMRDQTPPADAFHGQAPAAPKPADAFATHGDKLGTNTPKPAASAEPVKHPAHGIGRVSSLLGEWR
jgi:hypothetical protein